MSWESLLVVLLGAAIGSFLNVCISRVPAGISLLFPRSRCPACGGTIKVRDNIPLVSYLILKGRCRRCGGAISPRYPLVELLTALLAAALYGKYGLSPQLAVAFLFTATLVVVAFIDLEHQIIPHIFTLTGIPLFAVLAVLFMGRRPSDALLGIMIGAGTLYFVAVYYEAITSREGMGGGDINLLAMLGGFLGWQSLLFILLVASLVGTVAGLIVIFSMRRDMRVPIPFGPFLCLGGLIHLFFGETLTPWLWHP